MTATPIAQRIPDCPQCGYSWEGLPAAGQCPECGLGFDEASRQWKPSPPSLWQFLMPTIPFIAVLNVLFVAYRFMSPARAAQSVTMMLLGVLLITLGFTGLLIMRWRRHFQTGPLACILSDGILVHTRGKIGLRRFAWHDVRRVRVHGSFLVKSIAVHLSDGSQVDITGPFRSRSELDQFVDATRISLDRISRARVDA